MFSPMFSRSRASVVENTLIPVKFTIPAMPYPFKPGQNPSESSDSLPPNRAQRQPSSLISHPSDPSRGAPDADRLFGASSVPLDERQHLVLGQDARAGFRVAQDFFTQVIGGFDASTGEPKFDVAHSRHLADFYFLAATELTGRNARVHAVRKPDVPDRLGFGDG